MKSSTTGHDVKQLQLGSAQADQASASSCSKPIWVGYDIGTVTVLRADGLRVVIYTNDHLPAHVHVFGDGEAKINLLGPEGGLSLIWAGGMTGGEV